MNELENFWDNQLAEADEEISIAKEALKNYNSSIKPKIKEQENEFEKEFSPEWIKSCRKEYLEGKIKKIENYISFCLEWYKEWFEKDYPYFLRERPARDAEKGIARLKKTKWELRWLENPNLNNGKITPEMIAMAKSFPLKTLLNTEKDFVICPFHSEKTPSFYIKNNFWHCFSCGKSGDTIDLLTQRDNLSFQEAVKRLI